jgi:hypothetical protein
VSGCPPPETTISGPTCLQPAANDPDGTEGLQTAIDTASAEDTLVLCTGSWHLTKTVEITKNMTVLGAGDEQTILDGGNAVRVLQIGEFGSPAPLTLTVQDLQITKGKAANGIYPDNTGGGIFYEGTLTLIVSRVTGDNAAFAGGICNSPNDRLTLEAGSEVTGNSAGRWGGGIYNSVGTVKLDPGSIVTSNTPDNCEPDISTCTELASLSGTQQGARAHVLAPSA